MDSLNRLDRGWGEREGDREIPYYCESLTVWAAERNRVQHNIELMERLAQQVGRLIPRALPFFIRSAIE